MAKRVYLAGPISGLTYDQGNEWRKEAFEYFKMLGIEAYSPMRAKEYLRKEGVLTGAYTDGLFSSARNIMTRDFDDCTKADLVLCYLLGYPKVSIGSVMEIAWCYGFRVPLVVVMEKTGNPHDGHPMIAESIGFRVDTLHDALYVSSKILLPC